jgi:hypothetical protein
MRRIFLAAALAAALAGCRSTSEPAASPQASVAFDPTEAAYIKKTGPTTISGHAFWRDDKGGTVNAAGEVIRLVPATAYAQQRFAVLYRGQRSIPASQIQQTQPDPKYADYTRTVRAESSGRFEFEGVAPGEYFVTAQVRYKDKDQFVHIQGGAYNNYMRVGDDGGAMFERVTVTGREEKPIKLVLTNDR